MWSLIAKAQRLASIVFKGEDPLFRQLAAERKMIEERKKKFEDHFVKGIRELSQELKQIEENVVLPRESARDEYIRMSQELKSLRESKAKSTEVDLDEVHEWVQAVKDGRVEFDMNADIKACLQKLRSSDQSNINTNNNSSQAGVPSSSSVQKH